MIAACIVALVFAAGYITQRGNICAVAAVAELVRRHRAHRFAGFLLCAACSLLTICVAELLGCDVIARQAGLPVTFVAALGGAVYGAGALINGRCAFGTVARLGGGELSRLATVAGFFSGAFLAPALPAPSATVASPLLLLQDGTRALTAWVLVVALAWWLAGLTRETREPPDWRPIHAMIAFGLLIGTLTVMARDWACTSLLIEAASRMTPHLLRRGLMAGIFLTGAYAGAVAVGMFRLQRGSRIYWMRAAGGGGLMGIGARLVPGGNDAMLFVGLPLLLPNMVVAYCTMNAVLIMLMFAGERAGRQRAPT